MDRKIIVLGKNYLTPLGVIRSLAKAGYQVDLLYVANRKGASTIVASSKYLNRTIEIIGRNDQQIIDALLKNYANSSGKYILFPTDDYSALLIDRHQAQLSGQFLFPHVLEGSVSQKMDKSFQSALARQCGFNTAAEWVVSLDTDNITVPEDIPFPCFVKPLVSAAGGKSELERCDDRKALERKLQVMRAKLRERSVMIQEFLNIRQEYTIGGVCKDDVVVLPAIIKKTCVAQHYRGITLSGIMVDKDELRDDLPRIVQFLRSVRYIGMFDMEVMVTDKGLYFGELNLRCGGPSYAYFLSSINLPALAIDAICDGTLDGHSADIRLGTTFVNNKVAFEDFAYLFITRAELKRKLSTCDHTLLSDDSDPEPERMFNKLQRPRYLKICAKNHIKRLIGKK